MRSDKEWADLMEEAFRAGHRSKYLARADADRAEIVDLLRRCKTGMEAVEGLIQGSRGVCGLHLNGDDAPWDELRTGGEFEDWLKSFDVALSDLQAALKENTL